MQVNQILPTFQELSYSRDKLTESFFLKFILLLAIFSFVPTLFLPSVGEEGVYTNATLEMLFNQEYLVPTLFGTQYSRPPMFNWLIMLVTSVVGTENVVFAARFVNMSATVGTVILLYKFIRKLFPEKTFALFATAIFLSGDLLLRRGWIAYADSTFSFFIFAAIYYLWLAIEERKVSWLIIASLAVNIAFLSKVQTAYIFYGISFLILYFRHPKGKILASMPSIVINIVTILFPFIWNEIVTDGYGGLNTTLEHSERFFELANVGSYLAKIVFLYPLEIILRMMPASLIALVVWQQMRAKKKGAAEFLAIKIVFLIALLNILPYWLAPHSNIRYILPIYPFISLLIAYGIWHAGDKIKKLTIICLLITIAIKYVLAISWFPYEFSVKTGNAESIAQTILAEVKDQKLYTTDSTSTGLRVAVAINKLRSGYPPIILAPNNFEGYVLVENLEQFDAEVVKEFTLGKNKLYLVFVSGSAAQSVFNSAPA